VWIDECATPKAPDAIMPIIAMNVVNDIFMIFLQLKVM
jgi:hypothetical protein